MERIMKNNSGKPDIRLIKNEKGKNTGAVVEYPNENLIVGMDFSEKEIQLPNGRCRINTYLHLKMKNHDLSLNEKIHAGEYNRGNSYAETLCGSWGSFSFEECLKNDYLFENYFKDKDYNALKPILDKVREDILNKTSSNSKNNIRSNIYNTLTLRNNAR